VSTEGGSPSGDGPPSGGGSPSGGASPNGDTPTSDGSSHEMVARAIQDLIDSIPGAEDQAPAPDTPATSQPWAETASPSAKSKRPLDAILAEYAQRVAASPDARARTPDERHPGLAFYDRFGRSVRNAEGRRRRRRRTSTRKRRGGAGGDRERNG
jgi:hypothetical protein